MSHVSRTTPFRLSFVSLFLASLILSPTFASAAEELVLEEVLVTAQKQEQNIKDTPVAVNAISGESYNQIASFDLRDIDRLTAGVDLSGDAFNIDIKVRGTGTNLDAGVPARVQIFKDGAFISRQRPIFLSQFDIERFELLRGPQGTLYGKPSPAGSLVIHTTDPSLTVQDGYVKISAFSREGSNSQFAVSQPLIEDKLGLRIAGSFDKNSNADIHNETLNEDQISRTSAGRATIKWLANDKLDVRVSYNYLEQSADYYTVTDPAGSPGIDGDDRKAFGNERGYLQIKDQHAIGEVNYAITDDITLTNVTGYQETYTERLFDLDRGASVSPIPAIAQFVASDITKVINTEFRLHDTSSERWNWITGVYYQRTIADTIANTSQNGTNIFSINALNQTEEFGLFHHSGIQLNDTLKLTVGVRYNDASVNAISPATVPGPFTFNTIPPEFEKRDFQEFTGTLKLQKDLDEDTTTYISFDRGWRPASSTVDASGTVPAALILHADEPSTNFELGLKGRYWNDRADYQLAIYRQLYQDFQYQADNIQVGTGTSTFNAVVNADKVVINGIEIESNVLLRENWTGFYSLSYVDVEFDKFDDAPCNVGTAPTAAGTYNTCDLSGQRATSAPNFSGIISSEYSGAIKGQEAEWYVRGLVKHESSRYNRGADVVLDDYTTGDIFTGVRTNDGKYDLMLWAKNVTDEDVLEDIDFSPQGTSGLVMNNPFTAGITATWRFGLED